MQRLCISRSLNLSRQTPVGRVSTGHNSCYRFFAVAYSAASSLGLLAELVMGDAQALFRAARAQRDFKSNKLVRLLLVCGNQGLPKSTQVFHVSRIRSDLHTPAWTAAQRRSLRRPKLSQLKIDFAGAVQRAATDA